MRKRIFIIATSLLCLFGSYAHAYDFKIENTEGVIIYYNYNTDGTELTVTSGYSGCYTGDLIIPEEVTYMNRTRKVTAIGEKAFYRCEKLFSVTLPSSIVIIGSDAFYQCYELTSVTFSSNLTTIGKQAFMYCSGLTSVILPNSLTTIDEAAFYWCSNLTSITIPSSVTFIGGFALHCDKMTKVVSQIENPFKIYGKGKSSYQTFHPNTFNNATLYVPVGTKDKYMTTEGWKDFLYIEEGSGSSSQQEQCAKPTISYFNGKLTFSSETDGAICHSTITDSDINSYLGNEIQLGVTYNICAYATKEGLKDSDVAEATLCWIDQKPTTEGISDDITQIPARAVMIQNNNGVISVSGVDDGSTIVVYSLSGRVAGSAKAFGNKASVRTSLMKGDIIIVRIGENSVKVTL